MKDDLKDFIQRNRDGFDRKIPDGAVVNKILERMQQKEKPKPEGIVISFQVVRWAAAILALITFGGVTFWMIQSKPEPIAKTNINSVKPKHYTESKRDTPEQTAPEGKIEKLNLTKPQQGTIETFAAQDLKERRRAVLIRLKGENDHKNKQVMFAGLRDMDSPASRIAAVSGAYKLANSGNDIVDALVNTLNTDPNANVRLAALDGLNRFYRESYVRKKLLASLKKQQDPIVQIALINLLTHIRESGILHELEKIAGDENTQKAVKDCAYSGIIRLQSS